MTRGSKFNIIILARNDKMIQTMFTLLHISKQFTTISNQQIFDVNDKVKCMWDF